MTLFRDSGAPTATHVVFIGGGYTTVYAYRRLRALRRRELTAGLIRVTVVAPQGRHHFHGWTGELISEVLPWGRQVSSLQEVLPEADVIDATALSVDLDAGTVAIRRTDGRATAPELLGFDHLVLGQGSVDTERIPGVLDHSWSPKNPGHLAQLPELVCPPDAAAERGPLPPVAVIGGGLAGVETSAAIAGLLAGPASRRFGTRRVPRVVLLHSGGSLLPEWDTYPGLVRYAERQLQHLGVEVRLRTRVTEVMPRHVVLESGTRLSVGPVVSTLGQRPVVLPGTEFLTRAGDGRIRTDDALRVLGFDRIWAGGDAAAVPHRLSGLPCPANALWAIKHGRRIGGNLARALVGRQPRRFTYRGLGQLAALGVGKGVGHVYRVPLTGWTAWLLRIAFFVRFMPSREQAHEVLSDLTARSWPLSRRRGNPLQAGSSGGSHRKRGRR